MGFNAKYLDRIEGDLHLTNDAVPSVNREVSSRHAILRASPPRCRCRLQSPVLLGQAPQPPGVTFQVEVNYVDVDVVVTDEQGQFVTGLTRDDFAVFEDGKPQKIDTFSLVEIPVEKPDEIVVEGRTIPADTRTNREPFAGRVYVIVLDDLDVSAMRSTPVRDAARRFVREHMAANDLGAVVYTSGRSDAAQEFTTDRELLIKVDRQVSGPPPAVAQPRAARRVLPDHCLRLITRGTTRIQIPDRSTRRIPRATDGRPIPRSSSAEPVR